MLVSVWVWGCVCVCVYVSVCVCMCVCMCVCVCVSARLSVCLPACLSAYLSVCLPVCLPTCLPAFVSTDCPVCLSCPVLSCPVPVLSCLSVCLSLSVSVCLCVIRSVCVLSSPTVCWYAVWSVCLLSGLSVCCLVCLWIVWSVCVSSSLVWSGLACCGLSVLRCRLSASVSPTLFDSVSISVYLRFWWSFHQHVVCVVFCLVCSCSCEKMKRYEVPEEASTKQLGRGRNELLSESTSEAPPCPVVFLLAAGRSFHCLTSLLFRKATTPSVPGPNAWEQTWRRVSSKCSISWRVTHYSPSECSISHEDTHTTHTKQSLNRRGRQWRSLLQLRICPQTLNIKTVTPPSTSLFGASTSDCSCIGRLFSTLVIIILTCNFFLWGNWLSEDYNYSYIFQLHFGIPREFILQELTSDFSHDLQNRLWKCLIVKLKLFSITSKDLTKVGGVLFCNRGCPLRSFASPRSLVPWCVACFPPSTSSRREAEPTHQ